MCANLLPAKSLPGNTLLLEQGALPLPWPVAELDEAFSRILEESNEILENQLNLPPQPDQLSLLSTSEPGDDRNL